MAELEHNSTIAKSRYTEMTSNTINPDGCLHATHMDMHLLILGYFPGQRLCCWKEDISETQEAPRRRARERRHGLHAVSIDARRDLA
jgi:hypothetical protein